MMESTIHYNDESITPKPRARKFNTPDFLNDKNNNLIVQEDSLPKLRPIGRIKSPFIEQVNKIIKNSENVTTSPLAERGGVRRNSSFNKVKVISKMEPDESTDTNGDSGKENNENGIVSKARRKFSKAMHLSSVSPLQKSQSFLVPRSKTTTHVEDKFAKYFGVQVKAELSPIQRPNVLVNSKSFNQIGNQQSFLSSTVSKMSPAIKRRTEFRHQVNNLAKKSRSISSIKGLPLNNRFKLGPVTTFEDIQVTKEDLLNASNDFDKLFEDLHVTERDLLNASKEFEKLSLGVK